MKVRGSCTGEISLEDAHKTRRKKKNPSNEGYLTSQAYKRESGITVALVGPVCGSNHRQTDVAAFYLMYESTTSSLHLSDRI